MKNIIKKLSVFIAAVFVIISLMPVTAKAEDTYTLYARVPSIWKRPNVWAWTDSQENVFNKWPGQEMTAVGDGEWFSIELPVSATNVIINYFGDSYKTNDIKVNGTDVWITVCEDCTFVVDYTKPTGPPPATGQNTQGDTVNLTVVLPDYWTNPNLWAWTEGKNAYSRWPGEPMDAVSGVTYSKQIPDWVTGLKISSDGGIETDDIYIDPGKDVLITVYAEDDMVVEYVENTTPPDEPPTQPEETTPSDVPPAQPEETTPSDSGNSGPGQSVTPTPDSGNNNDNEDNGNNSGFLKFLIPAVCVVVVVVVVVATKKTKEESEE